MSLDISSAAMTAAQNGKIATPQATADTARATKAGQDFEGMFLSQMLGQMFEAIPTDGPFGGGQGEAMFRSLLVDEYGKKMAAQGGIGIAAHVTAELIKQQEAAQGKTAASTTAPSAVSSVPGAIEGQKQ
jgi:Rod binding protein